MGSECWNTLAGNSSLSFILFVCVKFPLCPHPFSHPVPSFVHPSIHTLCQCWLHPGSHNHIPARLLPPGSFSPPICVSLLCWRRPCRLSLSIAQASKTTNTEPDSYRAAFHLSYREEQRKRQTDRGGGREREMFAEFSKTIRPLVRLRLNSSSALQNINRNHKEKMYH